MQDIFSAFFSRLPSCVFLGFALLTAPNLMAAAPTCETALSVPGNAPFTKVRPETEVFKFDMPKGLMQIASVSDDSLSTGATLFYFPKGATVAFDARGGSVASSETSLFAPGSYSNGIDAIAFAGGSTMGLAVHHGVRDAIFKSRGDKADAWDKIPSVPGAIVYDFGARIDPTQDSLVYPSPEMGAAMLSRVVEGQILIGRAGAGTSTTANKGNGAIWGGQGAGFQEVDLGGGVTTKLFAAVVVNPGGDIQLPPDVKLNGSQLEALRKIVIPRGHKQNTTLSLIVTDLTLDRNQLQRLANMVHTSIGTVIYPFHGYTDGDICFAVSLNSIQLPGKDMQAFNAEEKFQYAAGRLMQQAVLKSVLVANKNGEPKNLGRQ